MRKVSFLLACLCSSVFLFAQNVPVVGFTFTVNNANLVTFTNTSTGLGDGIKRAFWSFGDGTRAITGGYDGTVHQYTSAGSYTACLKIYKYNATNAADSTLLGEVCKTVTIQQHCEAGFQWMDSITTNPFAHIVKLYGFANSNSNASIKEVCWNFGDGTDTCKTASSSSPAFTLLNFVEHRYTQGGTYNICLRVKFDGGCVAEKCITVTLSNPPPVGDSCAAAFTVNPMTATPLGRKFIAQPWNSAGKKPVRICWTFGDGKDTCVQYSTTYTGDYWVEHRYATYGSYEVCATIKYDGGCEKKKCNAVLVAQPTPPADSCRFDLAESPVAASSLERKFYVGLMPNRVAEKICWNFGDGTDTCIVLANPLNAQQLLIVHRYPAPGNYTVCAKVTYAGGCTVQRCRTVSITLAQNNVCGGYLTDSLVADNTVRFKGTGIQNQSDYVVSYNWNFGDGTAGSGQTINHTYAAPGRYNVCLYLKTASGCETRICKNILIAGNAQPQLVLTPNPVVNVLNATFVSILQQTVTVKIYNANGLMVRSYVRSANVGTNNWTFSDVGSLPTGVYSVIVQSANQFATAIFFKQ